MLIFQSNCQFGSKFWISPDENEAFLANKGSLKNKFAELMLRFRSDLVAAIE